MRWSLCRTIHCGKSSAYRGIGFSPGGTEDWLPLAGRHHVHSLPLGRRNGKTHRGPPSVSHGIRPGPRAAPHKLLLYLGRYTYRVALENRRITGIDVQSQKITFTWRDYRKDGQVRLMTLPAFTFIGRFLHHILPSGFIKIRYYGLYAHSRKGELLPLCRRLLHALGSACTKTLGSLQTLLESIVHSPNAPCPRCRQGSMINVGLIGPLAPGPFHPP